MMQGNGFSGDDLIPNQSNGFLDLTDQILDQPSCFVGGTSVVIGYSSKEVVVQQSATSIDHLDTRYLAGAFGILVIYGLTRRNRQAKAQNKRATSTI